MSSKLLFGIVVAGVGWVALGRSRAHQAAASALPVADTQAAGFAAPDVGEPQANVTGTPDIAGAAACDTAGPVVVGGVPVVGSPNLSSTGNPQSVTVTLQGPSGEPGMTLDHMPTPTGGADPSTQSTVVAAPNGIQRLGINTPSDELGTSGPNGFRSSGDASAMIFSAAYGPAGANGVPQDTQARKFASIGRLAGEVW